MSEDNRMVVIASTNLETDDERGVRRIMNHLNDDPRFEYMKKDGGGITIVSFLNDKLTMFMRDSCGTCAPIKIAGTRRHVELSLTEDFGEVSVRFMDAAELPLVSVPQLALK